MKALIAILAISTLSSIGSASTSGTYLCSTSLKMVFENEDGRFQTQSFTGAIIVLAESKKQAEIDYTNQKTKEYLASGRIARSFETTVDCKLK